MKSIIFLGFLIISFNCELTRHSGDVLKRERIFIEAHRGVSEGQKNHNTKEAILDSIHKEIEAFETDVWLTKDKKVILSHDGKIGFTKFNDITWQELQEKQEILEKDKIPLLEDIMNITKGKIFMNLEIKDENDEIWEKIQELIEKYEYYDQISICSFIHKYYEKVERYNKEYNRTIVFGFLNDFIRKSREQIYDINKPNHQISLNAKFIKDNEDFVKKAHDKGMTVGVWFFIENSYMQYYDLFEIGVDVIITDYPRRVANQLKEYYSDKIYSEGCKSIEKNFYGIPSCSSCLNGYELVYIIGKDRNLCKLKTEIDPDLYIKDNNGVYHEKNIFAIKMLLSPISNYALCQKNNKNIFYFEWVFDLYGYDYDSYIVRNISEPYHPYVRRFILNNDKTKYKDFGKLTQKHIKKLNFSRIEIYVDDNLINSNDFLCIDLNDTNYYSIYRVLVYHCYFLYNGEQKTSYNVEFRLFDKEYLSFVTYDDKFLSNKDSWRKSENIKFDSNSNSNSICNKIKDPFQDRISCINIINNCMYCENENSCKVCNYGFSLFNGQCLPSTNYENNLKYFTPDNGTNYYTCSSVIKDCEECIYDAFSFNNFHCSKCSNGLNLSETYECDISGHIIPFTNSLSGKFIGSSCLNEKNLLRCHMHSIEISNFSCWKFKDTFNQEERCVIYPDNENIQKEYYKFYLGIAKEELSREPKSFDQFYNKNEIIIPSKPNYKKNETITPKMIQDIITEEDLLVINKSNTCYSHFFKGYSNFWLNGSFPNITNPNTCYKAVKFSEHNKILDCGFAKISFYYGQKKYNVQTCYFIPDDNLSQNMIDFYRRSLIEEMWGKDGTWGKALKSQKEDNNKNIKMNNLLGERNLQGNDEISFEMTIQNKNGKVIKYDSKSYNITVVENTKTPSEDEDHEEDFEIIKRNNSKRLKFNLLISLFLIVIFI